MPEVILAAGTGAATSDPFSVAPNDTVTVSFVGSPGASDSIALQYSPDGEQNWYAIKENGTERTLSINDFVQLIRGPIRARVNRSGTTASVGVALHTKANP